MFQYHFFFLMPISTPNLVERPIPVHKKTIPYTSPLTFQCKILQNAEILLALLALCSSSSSLLKTVVASGDTAQLPEYCFRAAKKN